MASLPEERSDQDLYMRSPLMNRFGALCIALTLAAPVLEAGGGGRGGGGSLSGYKPLPPVRVELPSTGTYTTRASELSGSLSHLTSTYDWLGRLPVEQREPLGALADSLTPEGRLFLKTYINDLHGTLPLPSTLSPLNREGNWNHDAWKLVAAASRAREARHAPERPAARTVELRSEGAPGANSTTLNLSDAQAKAQIRQHTGQVVVSDLADVKTVRKLLAGARNTGALVVLNASGAPEKGLSELAETPSSVTVVHDIPGARSGFSAIHGPRVFEFRSELDVAWQVSNLRSAVDALAGRWGERGVATVDLTSTQSTNAAIALLDVAAATGPGGALVVIGHVEKGHLRFHDGSSVALSDVHTLGKLIVVTCTNVDAISDGAGLRVGSGRAITYEQGLAVADDIITGLTANSEAATYHDALLRVQNTTYSSSGARRRLDPAERKTEGDPAPMGTGPVLTLPSEERGGALLPIVNADYIVVGLGEELTA